MGVNDEVASGPDDVGGDGCAAAGCPPEGVGIPGCGSVGFWGVATAVFGDNVPLCNTLTTCCSWDGVSEPSVVCPNCCRIKLLTA
ncbi:hypothetical protein [Musicola paradisiaca]|uniref:hypothetical protein n=1 Tax=Musicola paradisiaca TaxID=69223 RepID=UPI001CF77607|nr:hypothetical protein [Musicola paradisiaca]